VRLLLDTHIWLWGLLAPAHLTPRVAEEEVAVERRRLTLPHQDPADRFVLANR
jgi:PIN domain nuclease of toxin-antitoxin system